MIRRLSFLACLLLLATMRPASAQRFVALGIPDADVLAGLQKLQKAVVAGDRATVAGMVNYPLRLNRGPDDHTVFATRSELLKRYDAVFTPEVRRAVLADKLTEVLGSTAGVPLGKGAVWLNSRCDSGRPQTCRIGITSVNQRSSGK